MPEDQALAMSGVAYGVAVLDAKEGYGIRSADETFQEICGYPLETLLARRMGYADLLAAEDREGAEACLDGLANAPVCHVHRLRRASGEAASVLLIAAGDAEGLVQAFVSDLSGLRMPELLSLELLSALPCGVADFEVTGGQDTPQLRFVVANDVFHSFADLEPETSQAILRGQNASLLPREEWEKLNDAVKRAVKAPGEMVRVEAVLMGGGREHYLLGTMICVRSRDGRRHMLCAFQDMQALRQVRQALEVQTERFDLIAASTHEYLCDYDVGTDTLALWRARDDGTRVEKRYARYLADFRIRGTVCEEDEGRLSEAYAALLAGPVRLSFDIRTNLFSQEMRWCRLQCAGIADASGKVSRVIGRVMDIQEEKMRDLALAARAERDALTELYNRGTGQLLTDEFLAGPENHPDALHAMFMIDLDDFKQINDRFSHAFGDAVLSEVARTIEDSFREGDIIARMGGDEFSAFVKRVDSVESLSSMADRLCKTIRRKFYADGSVLRLSVSIGVALYPAHGDSFDKLCHAADIAAYHAKAQGKNRYVLYAGDDTMRYESLRNLGPAAIDAPQLPFKDNLEHYLLRILSEGEDRADNVRAALELLCQHYNMQRAYIMHYATDGRMRASGYNWYAPGFTFDQHVEDDIPDAEMQAYYRQAGVGGMQIYRTVDDLPKALRAPMRRTGARSIVQYKYMEKGELRGLIGFDNCVDDHFPLSDSEVDQLARLLRILAIYALQETPGEDASIQAGMGDMLERLPTMACVVERDTYRLRYANERYQRSAAAFEDGSTCYRTLLGRGAPCEDCPMRRLDPLLVSDHASAELGAGGKWYRASGSWLSRKDAGKLCFLNVVEITEYKR